MTIPDRGFVESQLGMVRRECDLPESPEDDVEVRIGRGLNHPKDKGYAKFLVTLGYDPNWAGMLAAVIVEEGRVRAATSKKRKEFSRALRQLADPRLGTEAFLVNAQVVLEAMTGTTLTIELSDDRRPFADVAFIFQLRYCVAGDLSGRAEVVRMAKTVCRVVVPRGPRLTHASAAHEYFLESQSIFRSATFTWSPDDQGCSTLTWGVSGQG